MANELFRRIARFYDYETKKYSQDIPFYLDYAKKSGGDVLELACGTGRVLIPMAKEGIRITGLDISQDMLDIAARKISKLDANARGNIALVRGDMIRFNLHRAFSLVYVAFRSFESLLNRRDRESCLSCIREHLKKDATLILDLSVPRHEILAKGQHSQYHGNFYDPEKDVYVTRRAEITYDLVGQTVRAEWFYEWTDRQARFHRHIWSFEVAYLFRSEIELLLEKHGFETEQVFGSFDKSPYDYYSGEQIFMARRI